MPTNVEARRAAFKALSESYYNDLSCEGSQEFRHPTKFLTKAISAGVLESVVQVDPRMTSTAFGAAAMMIARKVMENAKVSRAFVDIEIAGQAQPVLIATFDRNAEENVTRSCLSQTGGTAMLCKPDDKIAPGLVSDVLMYVMEPQEAVVAEAVSAINQQLIAEARELEERMKKRKPCPMCGTAPGVSTIAAQQAQPSGSPGVAAADASFSTGTGVAETKVGPIDRKVWARAEAAAEKSYGDIRKSNPDKFYGTTMTIYKNMIGANEDVFAFDEAPTVAEGFEAEVVDECHVKVKRHADAKVMGKAFSSSHLHGGSAHSFHKGHVVFKFKDDKTAEKFKAHLNLHSGGRLAPTAIKEAALDLHELVFGAEALSHLEENARGDAALKTMMRIYGPLGKLATVREADPFRTVLAKAKQLHESITDYSSLVDELAIEIHQGDVLQLADDTVMTPEDDGDAVRKAITESTEACAALLQSVSRLLLLDEGAVPESKRASFEAFVKHIKAMTHPAP
jgi:hypothetical protein